MARKPGNLSLTPIGISSRRKDLCGIDMTQMYMTYKWQTFSFRIEIPHDGMLLSMKNRDEMDIISSGKKCSALLLLTLIFTTD